MGGVEAFLWGALGGVLFEAIKLFEALRAGVTLGRNRVLLIIPMVAAFSAIGGLMAFLVMGGTEDYLPLAAVLVGFAGTALLPLLAQTSLQGTTGLQEQARRDNMEFPSEYAPSQSPRVNELFNWWTADRVRTLLMAAAFLVALLTYLTK